MALKEVKVDFETFEFHVWCVFGPHRYLAAYIKKRRRRVYRDKDDGTYGMYFNYLQKRGGVLWLRKVPRSAETIGWLVHEMCHAVMDMHQYKGIEIDPHNDETFAYAVDYGVTKVLKGLRAA